MKLSYLKLLNIFLIIIFVIACKKEKDEINNPPLLQPTEYNWYPLTIGNSWKYHTEIHVDSLGIPIVNEYFDLYWTTVSDTLINGVPSTKIAHIDSNYSGITRLFHGYYANRGMGFYIMALGGDGSSFHLRFNEHTVDQSFFPTSLENKLYMADTVYLPNDPGHIMKYPVVQYEIWPEWGFSSIYNTRGRQWLSDTVITTPAGTFQCKRLRAFRDADGDGQNDEGDLELYQYFSSKGLIKETRHQFSSGWTLNGTTELVYVNF